MSSALHLEAREVGYAALEEGERLYRLGLRPILAGYGFEAKPNGIWLSVGTAGRMQGWKLHLSTIPTELEALCAVVLPVLHRQSVAFKVCRDVEAILGLNEGEFGATQVGKVFTVYPRDNTQALELALELAEQTRGFSGPAVVTDLQIGDILYTRYGGFDPAIQRDQLGQLNRLIRSDAGELVADDYVVPPVVPQDVEFPFKELQAAMEERRDALPGELLDGRYAIDSVLRPSPTGSVIRCRDVATGESVVIKEARRHAASDCFGRDQRYRLLRETKFLEVVRSAVRVPRVHRHFECHGHSYLVLEDLGGADFTSVVTPSWASRDLESRRAALEVVAAVADGVARLHAMGVVHRDLSPGNIRILPDRAGFAILDFELAWSLESEEIPLLLGTPGFMSPQQQRRERPATADDVFSLGALVVLLLSGADPRLMSMDDHERLAERLHAVSGAAYELVFLAAEATTGRPSDRPSAHDFAERLRRAAAQDSGPSVRTKQALPSPALLREVCASGMEGLVAVCSRSEHNGLWLSQLPEARAKLDLVQMRSASRGVAGAVYTFARLARLGLDVGAHLHLVEAAIDWLLAHEPTRDDQMPGLHFGECGVAVAITEAIAAKLIQRGPFVDPYLHEVFSVAPQWPDITHGAAGQALAALLVARSLDVPGFAAAAARPVQYLLQRQADDGSWPLPSGVSTLEGVQYTGFAHGAAGIVYLLSAYAAAQKDPRAASSAERGGQWLRARANEIDGSLRWTMHPATEETWQWWCHGAPGIALAFLKLYEHSRNEDFRNIASAALRDDVPDVANLSQCHGLAGVGEIFLEAGRVLGDEHYYERALGIAKNIVALRRTAGKSTYWYTEQPQLVTADLMVGCGGIIHFLARCAAFPEDVGPPLLLSASSAP